MGYDSYSQAPVRPAQPKPAPIEYAQPIAPPPSLRPAWLYADHDVQEPVQRPTLPTTPSPLTDTLQHSRERVASRWFALKGVFDSSLEQEAQPLRHKEARTPALALFSLAGGVGKTSMVATLGRALASLGEKVLLTDTTSYGLLPFYFGARELRPGVVRTFSPPSGSTDAPIYLVNYDVDKSTDPNPEWLSDEIIRNSRGTNRILLDLGTGSASLTRRIAKLSPTILVPVAPDMNSVIGLAHVEKYFSGMTDQEGRPIQPMYILNQFDASLPLHLDVREVMRQQLGDRLLPFVIRRSPSVSEALAEGMTVMDYAPGSPVAEDYMNLAGWLRSLSAPAAQAFRGVRWSER
jgi:cellulose synthase operon protein YhjQ